MDYNFNTFILCNSLCPDHKTCPHTDHVLILTEPSQYSEKTAASHSLLTEGSNVIFNLILLCFRVFFLSLCKSAALSLSLSRVLIASAFLPPSLPLSVIGYGLISSLSFFVLILCFSAERLLILHLCFMWLCFSLRNCFLLDSFHWALGIGHCC